ncbi:MAG: UDP-N-acetylmuramate dehydrogenase [Erysipelotrichaceae bacterium]|nr:UDP-N-acetylmuramate dehydrogenase [Erysipelotrichaceae bacterium]MDY5252328.1 UDP-N-acetylmuramate dehydrogenase [Erysipelotrichaceae bacterium]
MIDIYAKLSNFAPIKQDVSFKTLTTLRIGGTAAYVAYPENMVALQALVEAIIKLDLPFKVFGKGSNILCGDGYYPGVIIILDRHFDDFYFDDDKVIAQAGCSIIALAYAAMKKGLSGLEWASGIPGTLGGCLYMNAGAYKSCMKDIVSEVLVLQDGHFNWLTVDECEFAYRKSIFQQHADWIILACRLQLAQGDMEKISSLMDDRKQRRMATQPLNYPSAGSVFRNPEAHSAWSLIDGIGYRGKKVGGAMVSEKHVNFIVNSDGATCADFLELVKQIQAQVKEKYDVELIMEVEKFN